MATTEPPRGRPRDHSIDEGVLEAALAELASRGYAGFSLAAVAEAAGTTRPAIYRRWKDKAALVVDAVARLAESDAPPVSGDHFADLVAELEHFRRCISEAGSLPLAGLMLTEDLEPTVRQTYLDRVVAPRRSRIRRILTAAIDQGLLSGDADLDIATTFLTGSWYALRIAGRPVPTDWAARTAALVWTACGGTPPARGRRRR